MSININAGEELDSRKAQKILMKFLELSSESDYDFLANDTVEIGFNKDSAYAYLKSQPSIGICMNLKNDVFYTLWSSPLDSLKFCRYIDDVNSLTELDNIINELSSQDSEREEDYSNKKLIKKLIKKSGKNEWKLQG